MILPVIIRKIDWLGFLRFMVKLAIERRFVRLQNTLIWTPCGKPARSVLQISMSRWGRYLTERAKDAVNGYDHQKNTEDGIRLVCRPNADYRGEIAEILREHNDYFPYEYYSIHFSTFADEPYSRYKKKIRFVMIDSSNMKSEYATDEFIRRMYIQW